MSAIKLKSCPFCGSNKLSIDHDDIDYATVVCNHCEAVGPVALDGDKRELTDELAAIRWNNRPVLPEQET